MMAKFPQTLTIVADANIPGLSHYFSDGLHPWASQQGLESISIKPCTAGEIDAALLSDAQVLLVRSMTQVCERLLARAEQLTFVGSCTSGVDHMDTDYLAKRGIRWAHALGCNANAVAEYVLLQVIRYCEAVGRLPDGLRVGVIGYGETGRRVAHKLSLFGCEIVVVDPLKFDRVGAKVALTTKGGGEIPGQTPVAQVGALSTALSCDVVTLHVPLTNHGPHRTYHMIGPQALEAMSTESLLINASRGAVIDFDASMAWRSQLSEEAASKRHWVFDVFEHEPEVALADMKHLFGVTPHIAGHSQLGKELGTRQVWRQLLSHFGIDVQTVKHPYSAPLASIDYLMAQERLSLKQWLAFLEHSLRLVHTECLLRSWSAVVGDKKPPTTGSSAVDADGSFTQYAFTSVRRDYVPRIELSQVALSAPNLCQSDLGRLQALGVVFEPALA